jgi:predicted DNA-binding transcriptional regulator AlpA
MKAIAHYCRRSAPTVLDWIARRDFPAAKIGAEWVSDSAKIDAWFELQLSRKRT